MLSAGESIFHLKMHRPLLKEVSTGTEGITIDRLYLLAHLQTQFYLPYTVLISLRKVQSTWCLTFLHQLAVPIIFQRHTHRSVWWK